MLEEPAGLPAPNAVVGAEIQGLARIELRRLLRSDSEAAALQMIDGIGRDETEAAANLASRLDTVGVGRRADALLDEMNRIVSSVQQPVRRRRLLGLGAAPPPVEQRLREAEPALARLLDDLAAERDRLAQAALSGQRLGDRLGAADAALTRIAHLLASLGRAAEAAARELALDEPARARFVAEDVTARLLERSRDVATQLVVLQQARLSLGLLLENQRSLLRAIDRTRHVMVSALRTAVAAAVAVGEGARLAAGTASLDAAATRRSLESSVEEMRDALAPR